MDLLLVSSWLYVIGVFSICYSIVFSHFKTLFWGAILISTGGIISYCNTETGFNLKLFFVQTTLLLSLMFFVKAFTEWAYTEKFTKSLEQSSWFSFGFAMLCVFIYFFVPLTLGKFIVAMSIFWTSVLCVFLIACAVRDLVFKNVNEKLKNSGNPSEEFLLMFYSLQSYKRYSVKVDYKSIPGSRMRVYTAVGKDIVISIEEPSNKHRKVLVEPNLIDLNDEDREVLIHYFDTLLLTCGELTLEEKSDV